MPESKDQTPETLGPPLLTRAEISRRNGAKSKGPVSPEGKANSARNATKHGLLARTVVLPSESRKRFARLLNGLRAELKPVGEVEKHLVESMAVARWRSLRASGFERAVIGFEVKQRTPANPGVALEDHNTQTAVGVSQFTGTSRFLSTINATESRFERQFDRALRRLLSLRGHPGREAA